MKSVELEFILVVTELVLTKGIPAAAQLMAKYRTVLPTAQELRDLRVIKDPEEYFE